MLGVRYGCSIEHIVVMGRKYGVEYAGLPTAKIDYFLGWKIVF